MVVNDEDVEDAFDDICLMLSVWVSVPFSDGYVGDEDGWDVKPNV